MAEESMRPRRAARWRSLLAAATTALLAAGGLALAPAVAQAAAHHRIMVDVTEVANEKIAVGVTGSGFQDVPALPGQTEPHAYLALVPKGTDLSTIGQDSAYTNVSASIQPDGTFTNANLSAPFEVDAAKLDPTKSYEVISWPSRSNPSEANLYTRADAVIDWDALFPAPEPEPTSLALTATPSEGSLSVKADVSNIPVESPGVYVTLIEKGTLAEVTEVNPYAKLIRKTEFVDQAASTTLVIPAADLDQAKAYEVIAWPHMSHPTEANLYASADLVLTETDWEILVPTPAPEYDPQLTVTPNTGLDPAGANVTVSGEGYNPKQAIYVTTCADVPLEEVDFEFINAGCTSGAKLVWEHGAVDRQGEPRALQFSADGTFELDMTVAPRGNADATALYTIANHTAMQDRGQDAKATLGFDPAHSTRTSVSAAPQKPTYGDEVTLTAEVTSEAAEGTVTFFADGEQIGEPVSKPAGENAVLKTSEFSAGAHEITATFAPADARVFAPSTSEAASLTVAKAETGVTLSAPATVERGTATTLTSEVASGVAGTVAFFSGDERIGEPVAVVDGVASIETAPLDETAYTFKAVFVPADAENYEGAEAELSVLTVDHSEAGITINGEKTGTFSPGERIVFAGGPFAEGTEVSAAVHSEPIELGTATVGADGQASFVWTVPADFPVGRHGIVFTAGDTEVSAEFAIEAASSGAGGSGNAEGGSGSAGGGSDAAAGGSGNSGGGTGNAASEAGGNTGGKGLASTGAEGLAGLAAAGVLVLLAGAGVTLIAHRRNQEV